MDMYGETSCTIAATPDRVYALVSDITRMGEWSPECVRCEWMDGHDSAVVGAQFHGHNNNKGFEWTTPNTVVTADAGREFAWVVGTLDFEVCRWRYVLEGEGDKTKITESFRLGDQEVGFAQQVADATEEEREAMVEARRAQLIDGMRHTLEKLKAAAEGE